MSRAVALTTNDNPFDVFDDFENWFAFDESQGYHTSSILGRVAKTSDALPEHENVRIVEDAIDLIVEINPFGNYKKVVSQVAD